MKHKKKTALKTTQMLGNYKVTQNERGGWSSIKSGDETICEFVFPRAGHLLISKNGRKEAYKPTKNEVSYEYGVLSIGGIVVHEDKSTKMQAIKTAQKIVTKAYNNSQYIVLSIAVLFSVVIISKLARFY